MLIGAVSESFPSIEQFRKYMVAKMGEVEILKASLYDTLVYPTAGQIAMTFFQNPIGAGASASPGNAGNVKALSDTNMQLGGQLPAPEGFWVESIELLVIPGASAATTTTFTNQVPTNFAVAAAAGLQAGGHDVSAIVSSGSLLFTVGAKPYLKEANLLRFPPQCRMEYAWDIATSSGTVGETIKESVHAGGRVYGIDPGIAIPTGQNFQVQLAWPVIVATPSTFNASVKVILDGWKFRAVQ
jgi:hypothetical protein